MSRSALNYVGVGLLAFVVGPLFGSLLGKAGIIYGVAGVALYLAGRMGSEERLTKHSAWAGMLTVATPALAAGLPARWTAETLLYNSHISSWEQVKVSAATFLLFMALGAVAGMVGRSLKRAPLA